MIINPSVSGGGKVKTAQVSVSYNTEPYENIYYLSASGSITEIDTRANKTFSFEVIVPSILAFGYQYQGNSIFDNPDKYNGTEAEVYFEEVVNGKYIRTDFILVEDDMSLSITKS